MVSDLNFDISNEIDLINIKNLPEFFCRYFQEKSFRKYNNLRKFYSSMLNYFSIEIKDSYLNRILKYLSNVSPSQINLIEDINENLFDKELYDFSSELVDAIYNFEDYNLFYENLFDKINFIFYDREKYITIKEFYNQQKYTEFVFELIKHAFEYYKISLPGIVASRLYINARTLKNNVPNYIRNLYASAILGNDDAAILLYGSLSSENVDIATKILLNTKENEISLWIIAYNLENNRLDSETIKLIEKKYANIFECFDDFISNIDVTEKGNKSYCAKTLLMAYRMYYYCYNKYNYTKAGNSLGKLLIFDILAYKKDRQQSIIYGKKYLTSEMHKGNVEALTNIGIYFYNNPSDDEYSHDELKKILKTSALFADVVGSYYYAKILYDEGNYKEFLEPLEFAFKKNYGPACQLLGKYYELNNENDKAIKIYKKGIINKYYDCAYYISLIYLKDNIESSRQVAINYLNEYMNLFTDSVKKQAMKIINEKIR